ncbi:MAG: hypothetical protein UR66_C0010G0024 [Candidatus Moranbacteria bacterium GW2011_GWE1_35_17]|nr:MAG: hypothetical protein UR66_C0010G0024 [Candidatus Moranbacteria bacterium GW2011_GWE1_35_17]KKP67843.1 MAG: hypothetical protein UR65_C0065G0009 [Candidatus Moranbacteria bacterium GW2011_GWE2_35_164]KKP83680.1 MAG: hypothetical protein UR82_C0019G0008 [Candidatus Moranbacteria bacterium GW2011_GWF1_35_5]KKP83921.1 MAG: hypothetical protein UR83_C0030G0005 [Candidatus Moranbacteria bacterium GW2011_GWF2_35_54]
MKEIFCNKCDAKVTNENLACSVCGNEGKLYKITLTDTVKTTESFAIRQKVKGFKKFMVEFISRHKSSGNLEKHPEGVIEERRIDKEKNTYFQKVIDKKTGEVTHLEDISLKTHR